MKQAYILAQKAFANDEVPVGCVIVDNRTGKILAKAHNTVESLANPLCHAEIIALNKALKKEHDKYLSHCDIYVTLEPCPMCAAAISLARIRRLYFGAYDIKSGGVEHGPCLYKSPSIHHKPEVIGGIMELECKDLLESFFANLRKNS